MTEAPALSPSSQPAPYLQAWLDSLAGVLGQISGSPHRCFLLPEIPPELPPAGALDLWIAVANAGGLRGEMTLRLPPTAIRRLAQIFMSEASDLSSGASDAAPEVTAEEREATMELLRQAGGLVATALKPVWGEVQLRLNPAPGPASWPSSSIHCLRIGDDPATATLLEIHLSAALVAAVRAEKSEAAAAVSSVSSNVAPNVSSSPEAGQVQLDRLMDVELSLTLRFGSRRLLLHEVLDLVPGAVVNLDRQVEEPIDVLLDGRVVARGEVVVLDGNFGVRVTEVAPVRV